jgi:hypothetical protein
VSTPYVERIRLWLKDEAAVPCPLRRLPGNFTRIFEIDESTLRALAGINTKALDETTDPIADLRRWDYCWPGNVNLEMAVQAAIAAYDDLARRLAAMTEERKAEHNRAEDFAALCIQQQKRAEMAESALAEMTASASVARNRWNIERQENGDVLICFGDHVKAEACEYERWVPLSRARAAEDALGNLLAIIHRDGGQYAAKHGTARAIAEVIYIWAGLNQRAETAEAALRVARNGLVAAKPVLHPAFTDRLKAVTAGIHAIDALTEQQPTGDPDATA